MNTPLLSLNQAAKAAQKSPSTIHKYLKNGRLSYISKDDNGYKIDPSELYRVFPKTKGANAKSANDRMISNSTKNAHEYIELKAEAEILRQKNKLLTERLSEQKNHIGELQDQRDKWQEQANKILLTYDNNKSTKEQSKDKDSALIWLMPFLSVIIVGMALIILKSFNVI